jgi:hypothetical protein
MEKTSERIPRWECEAAEEWSPTHLQEVLFDIVTAPLEADFDVSGEASPLPSGTFVDEKQEDTSPSYDFIHRDDDHPHEGCSVVWLPVLDRPVSNQKGGRDWWGPVQTHHLYLSIALVYVAVASLIGFESIAQSSLGICQEGGSPMSTGLYVAVVLDFFIFEPVHFAMVLALRYAVQDEMSVDYSTTLWHRVAVLIQLSKPHPYNGEVRLWPQMPPLSPHIELWENQL